MKRVEVTKEYLESLKIGTFIMFDTFDNEENTCWTFVYCRNSKGFVYLGGGIDFGEWIGFLHTVDEVFESVNSHDFPEITICKLHANAKETSQSQPT